MLADRSEGFRREISGITTLNEAKEALAMLTSLGVAGDAEFHSYLHPGRGKNPYSFAFWAKADEELVRE